MSVGGIAFPSTAGAEDQRQGLKSRLRELVERFSPSQGWATFVLLLATLAALGYPITEAHWVDTPGLLNVLVWSAVTGLLLAKVRAPAVLLHPVALLLGLVVVVWQVSALIENEPLAEQIRILWDRLDTWYEAATTGGISTDLLPFSVGVLAFAWIVGYLSSWFTFRSNNIWVAVVLSGATIISYLSFLAEKFEPRFFLFMFVAMLLIVRMNVVQRHEAWRKAGIQFNVLGSWLTMHVAVWFSLVVVIVAAVLPLNIVTASPLTNVWRLGRAPMSQFEEGFARMFAGLPSRKDFGGRFFGKSLPFLGTVSFDEEIVFWANSEYPSYWLSQTYTQYTPKGWIAGDTREIEMGPDMLPPPYGGTLQRVPMDQALRHTFGTSDLLAGGYVQWTSRDAVMAILEPMQFVIDLNDASQDHLLSEDVRQVATALRERLNPPPEDEFVESFISGLLPRDLVLTKVTPDGGSRDRSRLETVTLERKEPIAPEVVSWRLAKDMRADEVYSTVSLVSMATDDELRGAGTAYGGFIRDHYLQLPATLPDRVSILARRLTQDARTPLDKAVAVQAYLRGPDFEYSQNIDAPPRNSDGVDYFLFEAKTGYSAYYASAMAVLMRAAGVPTRMVAGYAPGEIESDSGLTFVRDSDSHGWVQVYFPRYGWIDFEPTATYGSPQRGLNNTPGSDVAAAGPADSDPTIQDIDPFFNPGDDLPPFLEDGSLFDTSVPALASRLALGLSIALVTVAVLWAIAALIWNRGLSRLTPAERAYTKMSRLGRLAGLGEGTHQTPLEFASALGEAIPPIAYDSRGIAWAFSIGRYGNRDLADDQQPELARAWKDIRGSLAARALGRLNPMNGGRQP